MPCKSHRNLTLSAWCTCEVTRVIVRKNTVVIMLTILGAIIKIYSNRLTVDRNLYTLEFDDARIKFSSNSTAILQEISKHKKGGRVQTLLVPQHPLISANISRE